MRILDFNPKDFDSIELNIVGTNKTSKTEIPLFVVREVQDWMTEEEKQEVLSERSIVLSEIEDNLVVLDMVAAACASGHTIELNVQIENIDPALEFSFVCVVKEAKPLSEDRLEVKAKLLSGSEDDWRRFKEIFMDRQNEIDKFFSAAKG